MARDLPEYEESHKIQPVTQPTGFQRTFEQFGKNYEGLAQLGNSIAQNASNQIAQEQAIERAQTPGQTLIPAFTQADVEFTKAYKQEEYNVLQFQGNKLLTQMFQDLNKNPNLTANDLNLYEQNAQKSLKELLNLSQASSRPDLKRALEAQYYNYYYQLSNKVNAIGLKFMDEQNAAQIQQHSDNLENAYRSDNNELAEKEYAKAAEAIHERAIQQRWPKEKLDKEIEALDIRNNTAISNAELIKLPPEERDEYVSKLRTKLVGLSPLQQDQVISGVQQFHNQYEAAYKGQRQINYINALTKLNEGTLTQADVLSLDLDGQQIAQLELAQAKINKKKNSLNILKNNMNLSNTLEASQWSNKQVDEVYQDRLEQDRRSSGQAPTIKRMAELAQDIKHEIPSLKNALENTFRNGTYEQKQEAAKAYRYLANINPESLHGFDNKTDKAMNDFLIGAKGGIPQDVLLRNAEENLKPLTDEEAAIRSERLTKVKNEMKWNNPETFRKSVANELDISGDMIGDGVLYIFGKNFDQYYQDTGDKDKAKEYASKAIQSTHGITEVNGRKQFVYAPIEKMFDFGNGVSWVHAELYDNIKNMIPKQKEAYEQGAQPWYYEIEHHPTLEYQMKEAERLNLPIEKTRHTAPIKIKKVRDSGSGKNKRQEVIAEGLLEMQSDNATGLPVEGHKPSYGLYMNIDGRYEVINLPGERVNARFEPDYEKQAKIKNKKAIEQAVKARAVQERQRIGMETLVPSPIGGGLIHPATRKK